MPRLALRAHPEAEAEYDAARSWYAERDPQVAVRFVECLQRAFDDLRVHPRRWALWPGAAGRRGIRKCVVNDFPFVLPYLRQEEAVFILAIAHAKRRPGYWMQRVR